MRQGLSSLRKTNCRYALFVSLCVCMSFACCAERIGHTKILSLYSADGSYTFGEALSHAIVQKMVPHYEVKCSLPNQKKLLALGSILHVAREGDIIWGSGIDGKHPTFTDYHFRFLDVRAVRGPFTRAFLLKKGISCPETYGDPALLVPLLFPEFKRNPIREYSVIPQISEMSLFEGVQNVISLTEEWEKSVQKIVESKLVISSSLYGLIIAEAFRIPARLLRVTDNEPLFQYKDYYLGTGRSTFTYATTVEEALSMGGETPAQIDLDKLLRAFPYDVLPAIAQERK